MQNLFIADPALACESSGDDGELLLTFTLQSPANLSAIGLTSPAGKEPSEVRLYANKGTMSFGDAEDAAPTQVLSPLTPESLGEAAPPHKLRLVKFLRVVSLTLLVKREEGGVVALSSLRLFGTSEAGTDITKLAKVDDGHDH